MTYHSKLRFIALFLIAGLGQVFGASSLRATELILKDGRVLRGNLGMTTAVEEKPMPVGQGFLQPVLFVDDELRRTFIAKRLVRPNGVIDEKETGPLEKFHVWQKPRREGNEIRWVGEITKATQFDEFGRRTLTIRGARGPVDVVQGITDLTPHWGRVRGITHVWDMRVSPTSISSDTLYEILRRLPHSSAIDHQKKIARFFIQMERYEDAVKVLEKLTKDHPETREDIELSLKQLRRLTAQRLLDELKLRGEAGQHELVWNLLKKLEDFPIEVIPGVVLQEAREMIAQRENNFLLRKQLLERFDQLTEKISGEEDKAKLQAIGKELQAELNQNTLNRMAAFRLAADDKEMASSSKVALAVTGWILGSNNAVADLTAAISAYETREMVQEYLVSKDPKLREGLLARFASKTAATPEMIDQILKHMKPPVASEPVEGKPGYFTLEIDGLEEGTKVPYFVQLPPEYDPYKSYPTIVALHSEAVTPEDELTWWAGEWADNGTRHGQATRHGYIVIAPAWTTENQKKYEYSAHAHSAVLWALRDAMQRFSIDTDRVFLTGHSMGGEAAWDIGLAHPDLWAGVIPIATWGDRYIRHYWENAEHLPIYFVGGQLDGNWMEDNSQQFNRYIKHGYNSTIVEYEGRGHEHFHDDILRIFEWMSYFKRDFYPREFNCVSMRPWDNYFWWIELSDLPPATMVDPKKWVSRRGMVPLRTEAKILPNNGVRVKTGADSATIWLSPELVDFQQPVPITVNGKKVTRRNESITPSVEVMLEDARTRCDRQHVFWARVSTKEEDR